MRIRLLPIRETVTTGVAFANTGTSIPQTALGGRPSDAYRTRNDYKEMLKKMRKRRGGK